MTWLRWDTETPQHRVVGLLSEELNVRHAEALGLFVACCLGFGQHQPDGVVDRVPDSTLEKWAIWEGKRGRFAAAFRLHCVGDGTERNPAGVIKGWWRQDALLRKQQKDRERLPYHLRGQEFPQESSEIPPRESAGESRPVSGGDGGRGTEDGNGDELLPTTPGLPGRLISRLVGKPSRHAITGLLDALPDGQSVDAWAGCLLGCLDGQGLKQGRAATVEELAAACTDYLATAPHNWGLIHFRSFVDRIIGKRYHTRTGGTTRTDRAKAEVAAFVQQGEEPK